MFYNISAKKGEEGERNTFCQDDKENLESKS